MVTSATVTGSVLPTSIPCPPPQPLPAQLCSKPGAWTKVGSSWMPTLTRTTPLAVATEVPQKIVFDGLETSRAGLRKVQTQVTDRAGVRYFEEMVDGKPVLHRICQGDVLPWVDTVGEGGDLTPMPALVPETFDLGAARDELELGAVVAAAGAHLAREGYVVFANAVSSDLQERFTARIWDWLHRVSKGKVQRDEPASWEHWPAPNPERAGILATHGMAHTQEAWEVREATLPIWEAIYGKVPLATSMDGANVMRPTTGPDGRAEWRTSSNWLHVDTDGAIDKTVAGYQGVVNISGMDGTDGTGGCLQLVPKSHLEDYDVFMATHGVRRHCTYPLSDAGGGYTPVPSQHPLRKRMVRLVAPDRSLTVWSNATFHCNAPNSSARFRIAQYVNMCPLSTLSPQVLALRRKAFAQGSATTHWVTPCQMASFGAGVDYVAPTLSHTGYALLDGRQDTEETHPSD